MSRLYCTATSEKASKGQGGNTKLDMQLYGEGGQMLGVLALRYDIYKKEYFLLYMHDGETKSIFHLKETKGKRQKGECTHEWVTDSLNKLYCKKCKIVADY